MKSPNFGADSFLFFKIYKSKSKIDIIIPSGISSFSSFVDFSLYKFNNSFKNVIISSMKFFPLSAKVSLKQTKHFK